MQPCGEEQNLLTRPAHAAVETDKFAAGHFVLSVYFGGWNGFYRTVGWELVQRAGWGK
jgi:hypothetical protein